MQVIRRGLTYLQPHKWFALGAFLSMLLVTAANLYSPLLIEQLIDQGIRANSWDGILAATIGLLVIALLRGLFSFTNAYWSENASQGVAYDLRNEIFTKLQKLSFSFHDSHQTGQLMTRATSDVEAVRSFFAQGIFQLISAIITFIGSITILLITNAQLALAVMVTIPLIVLLFVWLFGRMGPIFALVQQSLGQLNNILQENIIGIRVVKAFTAEKYEFDRYQNENELLYGHNLATFRLFAVGFPTVFFIANIGTLIVIWFGGNLVISEQLGLGQLIAFNSYLSYLLMPIFQLGGLSQQLATTTASGNRIFEILDTENEVASPANPTTLSADIPGHITFENVSFGYGSDTIVLQDISFEALPGQTVALLGGTGSGKSTILSLIPRFYDVTAGRVLIDGINVRDVGVEQLRQRVGIVLQSVNLVGGTIRENIAYGRRDATEREIKMAATAAQAHDFIMEQTDGYETVLGERGSGLSGGQRQRIAIARVLLEHPRIMLFDDSLSAIDAETESKIRKIIAPHLKHHTTIVIAQRVSTVRGADLILVLDKGRIVARGTHKELLESSPLYVEIVNSQLDKSA
ncbi:MAG: ABC transporter ATP-binding protein [Candidatus Promineifilaceae bacterium]